jgi:diguanylate cyclase (GGDEF)-like protein
MPASDTNETLYAALAAAGDLGFAWSIADQQASWWGDAARFFAGANPPASIAEFLRRVHAEDQAALRAAIQMPGPLDLDFRLSLADGTERWVHQRATVAADAAGRALSVTGVLRSIDERKRTQSELEYIARHDDLTGHFNRVRLREAVDHALAHATRYQTPGAYFAIGIDRLTTINEAFGHATADAVIVAVGQRLDRCLRSADVIGRLDGDRFGVILSPCPEADMATAAERILKAVAQTPIATPSGPIHVTVSIGGLPLLDSWPSTHEVMTRADAALQRAKRSGRNCYIRFDDSAAARQQHRHAVSITEEVQDALKTNRLVLAVQPIVRAVGHTVDHYECLLRLKRVDGSILSAATFMPHVERTSLMRAIDRRALELAVEELKAHPRVRLAINVSGLTANDRGWFRALSACVRGASGIAERLIVEITETVALQDIDEMARFVRAVRDLGCQIALDDFGAGYTSFRYLKTLAINCVKIDGSFVRGLTENIDNQLFIRTLLGLAEGFGLSSVAECVETAEEAALLTERGVHMLQGYHFGAPVLDRPWLREAPAPANADHILIAEPAD